MNPADRVDKGVGISPQPPARSPAPGERKQFPKTAEDYVMIENRLAAQRETPKPSPQLDSIFDQLRGRLPK